MTCAVAAKELAVSVQDQVMVLQTLSAAHLANNEAKQARSYPTHIYTAFRWLLVNVSCKPGACYSSMRLDPQLQFGESRLDLQRLRPWSAPAAAVTSVARASS